MFSVRSTDKRQNKKPSTAKAQWQKLTKGSPHPLMKDPPAPPLYQPGPLMPVTAQHQNIYNLPTAAATTSKLPLRKTRPAPPNASPFTQSTLDISNVVTTQTSNIYHSSVNAANQVLTESIHGALYDTISSKFDSIITSIDGDSFSGDEKDLVLFADSTPSLRGGGLLPKNYSASKSANKAISSTLISTNYFAKANLYANSKLPTNLPPLQLYLPSYSLLCLAAQYSTRAYSKASGSERDAFINADWRLGIKAMVIKSVPIDHINCVVFAIRGSQTFMDWAVNLHSAPESPQEFLDDPGNLCHSGFLSVARKMVKPVAARLRQLLEENPARSTCSLLMTGHSAGGAVASLLYSHMLAENVSSELNILTGCFKRVHCLTFGAPPVSLLPLYKPSGPRGRKSLFMSFINEGDPVPRADPAYVRSLLRLYASPPPGSGCAASLPVLNGKGKRPAKPKKSATASQTITSKDFVWEVPPGALSNAGRLVVLRGSAGQEAATVREDDVKAQITSDQDLRGVVFGDPVMHMMKIYSRRVEVLATKAVTGGFLS